MRRDWSKGYESEKKSKKGKTLEIKKESINKEREIKERSWVSKWENERERGMRFWIIIIRKKTTWSDLSRHVWQLLSIIPDSVCSLTIPSLQD